jgi:hypothetical protein
MTLNARYSFRIQLSENGYPVLLVGNEYGRIDFGDIDTMSEDHCYRHLQEWREAFPNVHMISVGLRADYSKENPYEVWNAVKQFCADNGIEYVNTCG